MPPAYAVIIPHYNDVTRLGTCLAALAPQLDGSGEVVVADNNSTDDLGPLKAAHPGIRFVTEPEKGAANARNAGVAATTAPLLFFLDADCVPGEDWIATALRVADRADLVGGSVTTFDETPAPRSGAEAFETVFAFNQKAYVEEKGFSVTANLLTRRDVFQDVGGFIDGLSEDVNWCHRARDKGYGIAFAPDLAVSHPTRSDWPALEKKWRRLTREMYLLNGTSPMARAKWLARAGVTAAAGLLYTYRPLAHGRLRGTGEKLRGVGTLWRLYLTRAGWMARQVFGGSV